MIDDEPWINDTLKNSLENAGFKVVSTTSPHAGLRLAGDRDTRALILDLGLPGMNGLELLARLRRWTNIPVLVLSAEIDESVKMKAFEQGADDYISKPFTLADLVARVNVLLRRSQAPVRRTRLTFGDLELDLVARRAWLSGSELLLAKKEFHILQCLAERPGEVMAAAVIIAKAWGHEFPHYQGIVKVHIGNLRKKLGSHDYIRTVHGFGYSLTQPRDPVTRMGT